MQRTTSELAKELSLPESTIRTWVRDFDIPTQKKAGKLRFSSEAEAILRTVERLRGEGRTSDTIRRVIIGNEPARKRSEEVRQDQQTQSTLTGSVELEAVVRRAISESNDLAEKYARAAHTIGSLEKENQMLRDQLAEKTRLLEARSRSWWKKLIGL